MVSIFFGIHVSWVIERTVKLHKYTTGYSERSETENMKIYKAVRSECNAKLAWVLPSDDTGS